MVALTRTQRSEREREEKIRRELTELQGLVDEAERAAARFDELAAAARSERAQLAAQEAAGLSAEQVDARALELLETERRHAAAAEQRRAVGDLHRENLQPLELDLADALYARKLAAVNELVRKHDTTLRAFTDALAAAAIAADNVAAVRERLETKRDELEQELATLPDPDRAERPDHPAELDLQVRRDIISPADPLYRVVQAGRPVLLIDRERPNGLLDRLVVTDELEPLIALLADAAR
jgi:hypothetical protein